MLNSVETLLTLLLLTSYLFTIVTTKRCEDKDGGSYVTCDDDEHCCDDDHGRTDCCSNVGIVSIIIGIIFLVIAIVTGCFCCYCCYKNCPYINPCINPCMGYSTADCADNCCTMQYGLETRRREIIPIPRTTIREIRIVKVETPNQPPLSHSNSNTNNIGPPPHYPSNDPPPLYSEVNL